MPGESPGQERLVLLALLDLRSDFYLNDPTLEFYSSIFSFSQDERLSSGKVGEKSFSQVPRCR